MDTLYQRDYPNGSKVVSAPCVTCGGPKAIGGLYEAECPDCRIRRGLVEAAVAIGVSVRGLAAAVRDGQPIPTGRCEACFAETPAYLLFELFGVGRICARCAGLGGAEAVA